MYSAQHHLSITTFEESGRHFVFDGNTLQVIQVSKDVSDLLSTMERYGRDHAVSALTNKLGISACRSVLDAVTEIESLAAHPREQLTLRADHEIDLNEVYLILSASCNLSCKYCFVPKETRKDRPRFMTEHVARQSVDYAVQHSKPDHPLMFILWGGEPLLNQRVIEFLLSYTESITLRTGRQLAIATTTNGTLLTSETATLLARHRVVVNLSIDGSESTHNAVRVFHDGSGSFAQIKRNVLHHLSASRKHFPEFVPRARMTITRDSVGRLFDNVRAIWDAGIPIAWWKEVDWLPTDSSYSLRDQDFDTLASQLALIKNFLVEQLNGRDAKRYYPQVWWDLHSIHQRRRMHGTCGAGFKTISIDTDGSLWSCYHLMDDPRYACGSIVSGMRPLRHYCLSDRMVENIPGCARCSLGLLCGGGCVAKAIAHYGDPHAVWANDCRSSQIYQKYRLTLYAALLTSSAKDVVARLLSVERGGEPNNSYS
jgi:uncharacterized protein